MKIATLFFEFYFNAFGGSNFSSSQQYGCHPERPPFQTKQPSFSPSNLESNSTTLYDSKRKEPSDIVFRAKDVPLLLSRSLGPTLHASLQKLSLSSVRNQFFWHTQENSVTTGNAKQNEDEVKHIHPMDPNESNSEDQDDDCHDNQKQQHSSTIELCGPILPCAVRDLLCASAHHLLIDKIRQGGMQSSVEEKRPHQESKLKIENNTMDNNDEKQQQNDSKNDNSYSNCSDNDDDGDVGSHYFVMHMQPHQGEEHILPPGNNHRSRSAKRGNVLNTTDNDQTKTGGPSSVWFNSGQAFMGNNDGDNLTVKKDNSLNDRNNNTLIDDADNTQHQSLNRLHECENGEIISMTVVWDVMHSSTLAYKTQQVLSFPPSSSSDRSKT